MKRDKASANHHRLSTAGQHDASQSKTRELPALADDSRRDTADEADNKNPIDYTTQKLYTTALDEAQTDANLRQPVQDSDDLGHGRAGMLDHGQNRASSAASDSIVALARRAEAAELDRAALEERLRMMQGRSTSGVTITDSRKPGHGHRYWLRELILAMALGLALLSLIDYLVAGDAIPLLPEPNLKPTTAAPVRAPSSTVARAASTNISITVVPTASTLAGAAPTRTPVTGKPSARQQPIAPTSGIFISS